MSNKQDIQQILISMGFPSNYIGRAFKVYEKNYGYGYNVEVITEIIVRLQNKDKRRANRNNYPSQQFHVYCLCPIFEYDSSVT